MSERIALFPLRTVLFPRAVLPLRIFETRYVDLVRRSLREQGGFGIVLIRAGAEVGEVSAMAPVGTYGRIEDFGSLPDGLLRIVVRGERRFRIRGHGLQADGLHLADVEWLDDPPGAPLAAQEFVELRGILDAVLREVGNDYPAGEPAADDALWVSSQLAQLLPAPAEYRQQLLELDDARERLARLDSARAGDGD